MTTVMTSDELPPSLERRIKKADRKQRRSERQAGRLSEGGVSQKKHKDLREQKEMSRD